MGVSRRSFIKAVKEESRKRVRLTDAANSYKQAFNRKRDKGIAYYDEAYRKKIYDSAILSGFSPEDLEKMAYYLEPDHWNQDEVYRSVGDEIIDAISLFYNAETFLNANMQVKPLGAKMYDTVASIGDHLDEGGTTNDN